MHSHPGHDAIHTMLTKTVQTAEDRSEKKISQNPSHIKKMISPPVYKEGRALAAADLCIV